MNKRKMAFGGTLSQNEAGYWNYSIGSGAERRRLHTGTKCCETATGLAEDFQKKIKLNNAKLFSKAHINDFIRAIKEARKRANKSGIEYNITESEIKLIIDRANGCCEVTGIFFQLLRDRKPGERDPFMPSLDRIDSEKGYTFDNVRLVCIAANLAMNTWGDWVLDEFTIAMKQKRKLTRKHSVLDVF